MTASLVAALVVLVLGAAKRALGALRRRRVTARLRGPATTKDVMAGAAVWATGVIARRRIDSRIERDLPLALESIARGLRSGASLRLAVAEAGRVVGGPLGDDLARVAGRVDHGATLVTALEAWVGERPLAGVRLAAAALALGAETGGAQARAVDGVAATLRDRLAAAAEVRAQATQARVSAAVIALAPIAFCALATATDPRTASFLFKTPLGLTLLAAGLGLDGLGAFWMNRLTRIVP